MTRIIKKSTHQHTKTDNNSNNNTSCSEIKFKGVRKRKWGKWVSEIRLPNSRERIWLGSYDSPVKAARAFDAAQFCLRGNSANFNFPDNPPDISGGRSMSPLEIQAAATRFANLSPGRVVDHDDDDRMARDESEDYYSLSYSPSISEETSTTTTTTNDGFEMVGVETSFHHEGLSLNETFGSGNYVSDFGYFIGLDDFYIGNGIECDFQNDTYDVTLYQDTYLWTF